MHRNVRILLLVLFALTVSVLSACDSLDGNTDKQAENRQAGEEIYTQYCATCHGPNGEGQRPDAPLQKDETGRFPAPPHDDTGHTWHHDDDLVIRIINEGGMGNPRNFYEMPAFGDVLNEQEVGAVLVFIKTMWTDDQRAAQQTRTDAVRSGR